MISLEPDMQVVAHAGDRGGLELALHVEDRSLRRASQRVARPAREAVAEDDARRLGTWATNYMRQPANLLELKGKGGWSTWEQVERYSHAVPVRDRRQLSNPLERRATNTGSGATAHLENQMSFPEK